MVDIISGGTAPVAAAVDGTETTLFSEGYEVLSTVYDRFGAAPISSILSDFQQPYLQAMQYAKNSFNKLPFGGLFGPQGFNMQLIRASTIYGSQTTPSANYVANWARTFTTTGWQALFGSQTSPYTLATTGNGQYIGTTYNRVAIMFTHIIDTSPPKYDEIRFGVQQNVYPVFPTTYTLLSDLYVTELPAPIYVDVNQTFFIEANIERLGSGSPQLLGIQYVTKDYANIK